MSLSIDKHLALHSHVMRIRSERANLMANNIANAETPNYKARDVDFASVLAQAEGQGSLRTTHNHHFAVGAGYDLGTPQYRVPTQPSIDGNTVDTQREKANFADNSLRYMASLRFLNDKISGLKNVLRGE